MQMGLLTERLLAKCVMVQPALHTFCFCFWDHRFCVALKLQRAVFKVAGDGGHFRGTATIELMPELMTFGDRKVNVDFEDEIFRGHEQEIVLKIDDLE